MLKRLVRISLGAFLIFSISCATKKDKEGEAGANLAEGGDKGPIVNETMTFPPTGSDAGSIPGLSTVFFAYDSSLIDGQSREILKSNAAWIKSNTKAATIQIEGHCDNRGSVEYNLALGERRAKAVKEYLTTLGVDSKRITIISYGKEKPLDVGDSDAVYSKNRRANFVPLSN